MKQISVLIIDDNNSMIRMLSDDLNDFFSEKMIEVEISEAKTLDKAISLLKSNTYNLIILDGTIIPPDHGRDVLAKMTLEQISKTVIYSAEMDFITECLEQGMQGFLKNTSFFEALSSISKQKKLLN